MNLFFYIYGNEHSSSPDHAALDGWRFTRYLDRLHVEEDRLFLVGFQLRKQWMQQDAASRVDQESIGELGKTKVDDRREQRVKRYVDTRNAAKCTGYEDWQTFRRHHSCTNCNRTHNRWFRSFTHLYLFSVRRSTDYYHPHLTTRLNSQQMNTQTAQTSAKAAAVT